jgi:sulfur transfer protein SufE
LLKKCNPGNISNMDPVKFFSRLGLERKLSFFKAPCSNVVFSTTVTRKNYNTAYKLESNLL